MCAGPTTYLVVSCKGKILPAYRSVEAKPVLELIIPLLQTAWV